MKTYCIVNTFPKMIDEITVTREGLPLFDKDGKQIPGREPFYEKNYYCGTRKDSVTGTMLVEWDTDQSYAYPLSDKEATMVLLAIKSEGARIQRYKFEGVNRCEALAQTVTKLIFENPVNKN